MSEKMKGWDKVGHDVGSGPGGAFKWFLIVFVSLALLGGAYNMIAKPGGMFVDRMATKTSFQYREGMEQRGAILQSNIAEVDAMIRNAETDAERQSLMDQKRVLRSQLRAITINE